MAEKSGFFNAKLVSGSYDRTYQAEDFADCLSMFIPNGIYVTEEEAEQGNPNKTTVAGLKPYGSGTSLKVAKGKAFINGYWYVLDSDATFSVTVNTTRYVMLMYTAADREVKIQLLSSNTIPKTDAQWGILLGSVTRTSSGLTVTDSREDFMVGSPKSLQTIADQAQQTLRELKSSMSNLTPKDWQKCNYPHSTNFTQNTNGTAYVVYNNTFGTNVDKFTIDCLYYDSNYGRHIPIPCVSSDDVDNATKEYYFTYQITIDSTSQRNVTARVTISKALYNLMKENTAVRSLKLVCRRYAN